MSGNAVLTCNVPPGFLSYLDAFLIILIMVLCLSQNTLILLVIYKLSVFQTPSNIFIGCLALADMYVSFVPLPMEFLLYVCSWVPNHDTFTVLDVMASMVSITSLVAIACDRYYIIVHPYKYERNMTILSAVLFSTVVWVYGTICALLRLVVPVLQYTLFIVLAAYVLPTMVMFWSNVRIAAIAKRHAHRIFQLPGNGTMKRLAKFSTNMKQRKNTAFKSTVHATMRSKTTSPVAVKSSFDVTPFCVTKNKTVKISSDKTIVDDELPSDVSFDSQLITSCNDSHRDAHATTHDHTVVIPEENDGTNAAQCKWTTSINETKEPRSNQPVSLDNNTAKSHREVTFAEYTETFARPSSSCSPDALPIINAEKETFKKLVNSNLLNHRQTSFLRRETIKVITQARKLKQELKASMTLAVVMGIFLVLWTPFIAVNISFYVGTFDTTNTANLTMLKYFKMLHYMNSAVNPACYVLLNSRWRKAVKKILSNFYKRVRCKKKVHPRSLHSFDSN